MIVTPNKVHFEGKKILEDETTEAEKSNALIALEDVSFSYPSKPDVKVLKDVNMDVK